MRTALIATTCLLVGLAPSCNFAPQNCRPDWPTPCEWRVASDEPQIIANMPWWELFEDHVLNELIEEALANNRDLALAVATVNEYYARLGIAQAPFWPSLGYSVTALRQESSQITTPLSPGAVRTLDIFAPQANISYEVDLWGQIRNTTQAALHELLNREEMQRGVIITLISAVARAYVELRTLDKQLVIAEDTLKSRIYSLELAALRFKEGLTSELPVNQAEADLETARIQKIQLQVLIPQKENELSVLIGRNPEKICRGKTIDRLRAPEIPCDLPSEILCQRPDILQAEQNLYAANARLGIARAAFFPSFNLSSILGFSGSGLDNTFTPAARNWNIASSLLGPLFQGGQIYFQTRSAYWVTQELIYTYQKTIQTAFKEVNNALIAHQLSTSLLKAQSDQVRALENYLSLAKLLYDNGQTDYLTVLDAERNLFSSQLNLVETQANVFLTIIDVYRALGGGWEPEFEVQEPTCSIDIADSYASTHLSSIAPDLSGSLQALNAAFQIL